MASRHFDVMYCEGPGDIVSAYRAWSQGADFISETVVTFSAQVFDFCRSQGLSVLAISYCAKRDQVSGEAVRVENMPRHEIRLPKIGYELSLFIYLVRLLLRAVASRPRVILISSGVVQWWTLPLLRLSGARIAPILHNTLWAEGHPPAGWRGRLNRIGFAALWGRFASATFAVSAAAVRQVERFRGSTGNPVILFQPLFLPSSFPADTPPADFSARPFNILFVGRMDASKGIFDFVEVAERLQAAKPGMFTFTICGDGDELGKVRHEVSSRGLDAVVIVCGRLKRPELVLRYASSHVVIVPTRTTFAEGYAMVVAEAVLFLRPVVTCAVVPAAESLRDAIMLAEPDDPQSYLRCILELSESEALYNRLVSGARALRPGILDDSRSLLNQLNANRSLFE